MKKESILFGIIGLLIGVIVTGFAAGQVVNNDNTGMMRMMGINTSKNKQSVATDHSTMSMADMNNQLKDLSGDEFDKAFIEMMIDHHEGAVDMAKLIPSRAKHDEIKTLGEAIITAQTKEIADMKQWQEDWGYSTDEMMNMMHGGH
ncbi:MAG: DUF305 domain-containing protein [Candidatus Saccharimonadales bacterium]